MAIESKKDKLLPSATAEKGTTTEVSSEASTPVAAGSTVSASTDQAVGERGTPDSADEKIRFLPKNSTSSVQPSGNVDRVESKRAPLPSSQSSVAFFGKGMPLEIIIKMADFLNIKEFLSFGHTSVGNKASIQSDKLWRGHLTHEIGPDITKLIKGEPSQKDAKELSQEDAEEPSQEHATEPAREDARTAYIRHLSIIKNDTKNLSKQDTIAWAKEHPEYYLSSHKDISIEDLENFDPKAQERLANEIFNHRPSFIHFIKRKPIPNVKTHRPKIQFGINGMSIKSPPPKPQENSSNSPMFKINKLSLWLPGGIRDIVNKLFDDFSLLIEIFPDKKQLDEFLKYTPGNPKCFIDRAMVDNKILSHFFEGKLMHLINHFPEQNEYCFEKILGDDSLFQRFIPHKTAKDLYEIICIYEKNLACRILEKILKNNVPIVEDTINTYDMFVMEMGSRFSSISCNSFAERFKEKFQSPCSVAASVSSTSRYSAHTMFSEMAGAVSNADQQTSSADNPPSGLSANSYSGVKKN